MARRRSMAASGFPFMSRRDHHRQIGVRTARDKALALVFVQDKYCTDGEARRAALIIDHQLLGAPNAGSPMR